jgi:hypothetical protein
MVKDVSDIEDDFAMKRRREKAARAKRRKGARGEHTIPPRPIKHILSSYTLSKITGKRHIQDYVEAEAHGEKVQYAEKMKSERVLNFQFDCWDVHTQRDRYWVITSPTNLYSQRFFPSLDFTLSFHVGCYVRMFTLKRGAPDPA